VISLALLGALAAVQVPCDLDAAVTAAAARAGAVLVDVSSSDIAAKANDLLALHGTRDCRKLAQFVGVLVEKWIADGAAIVERPNQASLPTQSPFGRVTIVGPPSATRLRVKLGGSSIVMNNGQTLIVAAQHTEFLVYENDRLLCRELRDVTVEREERIDCSRKP